MAAPGPGESSSLRALASSVGVIDRYVDNDGVEREASTETLRSVLAAMGVDGAAPERCVESPPPATLARCVDHRERLGDRRGFGLWANLYAVRGDRGLGVGNITDLRALVELAASAGASFVGISPLHAHRNRHPDVSPYCGLSRIFRNPIYVDVEAVPEFSRCPSARAQLDAESARVVALRASDELDYAAIADLHHRLMGELYDALVASGGERMAQLEEFRARRDGLVNDYGVFLALTEQLGVDWRSWPADLRDPRSSAVRDFADQHAVDVGRHVFAQFELERQLSVVTADVSRLGVEIGLYQDLALGSSPDGFDAWAFPGMFVQGVSLGAPPDAYSSHGQDWAIPPVDPRRIADDDYRYWRLVLRSAMEHSGALRVDHAMGLTRQFWVPHGATPSAGCYVRYPLRPLLQVLGEESRRHDCIVVAEDLGTVPVGFDADLADAQALSSRVLLFERDPDGQFQEASRYSDRALVTANTHDHPTLAAWAGARDIELRRQLGLIETDDQLSAAREERAADVRWLGERLGLAADASVAALTAAAYEFLARTPCPLVGVSLDDLAGETDPVNIPGVSPDRYPSWTRRMTTSLAEVAGERGALAVLAAVAAARRG